MKLCTAERRAIQLILISKTSESDFQMLNSNLNFGRVRRKFVRCVNSTFVNYSPTVCDQTHAQLAGVNCIFMEGPCK